MSDLKKLALLIKSSSKYLGLPHGNFNLQVNQDLIIETNRGIESAKVVFVCSNIAGKKRKTDIFCKRILNEATAEDLVIIQKVEALDQRYFQAAKELITQMNINIKILKTELLFDQKHFFVHYSIIQSEQNGRKKALISQFSGNLARNIDCKVIAEEVTDRNVAKLVNGLGVCGYEVCCARFLQKPPPVSIKVAKEQGLPINMQKLSGQCGKLKCCLRYEKDNYVNGKLDIGCSGCHKDSTEEFPERL
jgi:cell fate regulator YaaT (PSP1 superfamily)